MYKIIKKKKKKKKKKISVSPDFYNYDEVDFFTKIYFYDKPKDGKGLPLIDGVKMEVKLKFGFSDLANDENALSIIETSIKEELEKVLILLILIQILLI